MLELAHGHGHSAKAPRPKVIGPSPVKGKIAVRVVPRAEGLGPEQRASLLGAPGIPTWNNVRH